MNVTDAAKLLTTISALDNRKPSRDASEAWAATLHPRMSVNDALTAAREHFATSTEYLVPAHLNAIYRRVRKRRVDKAILPPLPGAVSWQQERDWQRAFYQAVGDGHDKETADRIALEASGTFRGAIENAPDPQRVRDVLASFEDEFL